jgi:hypothetical protein
MHKTDDLIAQALAAEDRDLLVRHAEPGYFTQAFGLFRGTLGWVIWLAYLTGVAAFIGFAIALWQAWTSVDVAVVVRWGVVAVVLFQYSAMIKAFLGSHLEANRLLREVKRVELQVAMLRAGETSGH